MTARPPAATGYRERLSDARRALEQLGTTERQYLDRQPYRLVHQYDPRGARYTVHVHVAIPRPGELATLAGQVLENARDALDALAAALVPSGSSSGRRAGRFPIHDSLPEFAQRSRRAIGAMPDEAQATIEELQPYHTFGGFRKDPLWLLRELGAAGGPMLAAGALRDDSELGVNTQRHVRIVGELHAAPGVFEDGAAIVDVAASVAGPDPKLDLFFRPSFTMAFAAQGPARGAAVVSALGAICDRVEQVITALEVAIPA